MNAGWVLKIAAGLLLAVHNCAVNGKLSDVWVAWRPRYYSPYELNPSWLEPLRDTYRSNALRDVEHLGHSSLWGHQYTQGGAGEGKQMLGPLGTIPNKDEVKTDAILPSFCEPPNPCPPGMSADDGCLEEFVNNAEFSRQYQANQDCLCDEDHMFTCPPNHRRASESTANGGYGSSIEDIFQAADIKYQHKGLVAKKFHQKKRMTRSVKEPHSETQQQQAKKPTAKQQATRSRAWETALWHHFNPYLRGNTLKVVAKKGHV